ncbi:MAG: M20/M25/M40 family metallo-hydrolase [Candidatus Woesebacteria bacterium]|nr:M20/M25/M40 family metallo-hydrolase [Candidatus Woesebacteria bacterium]
MSQHEKLLNDLIEIKSYSGEEEKIRDFIYGWFEEKGIESFIQDENLVVHFNGKDQSKAFIFNSHMDTVSKGDQEWKYGPWTPTIEGDKLVGLGASDMKGGLVASMLLAEKMHKKGKPQTDMWFTYVVKEEQDGSGTQSFADWFNKNGYPQKYTDVAGIFTEPTNLKEIEHGHRGNLFLKITAIGDSGHGARPHLIQKHSVREIIRFSDILQEQFTTWRKEFNDGKFEPPTVGEMTSIQAGVAIKEINGQKVIEVESPNKFPSVAVATFDIRTTPDFHKVAFDRIVNLANINGMKVEYAFPPGPAGYTDINEKIVKVATEIVKDAKLTVSKGSADLGFLTAHGIKAIIFGPGIKEQCHRVNEYTYPAQILEAVEIYNQIVTTWAK